MATADGVVQCDNHRGYQQKVYHVAFRWDNFDIFINSGGNCGKHRCYLDLPEQVQPIELQNLRIMFGNN